MDNFSKSLKDFIRENDSARAKGYRQQKMGHELQTNAVVYRKGNKGKTVRGASKKDAPDTDHKWY